MSGRNVGKLVFGSMVVYFVMAACGSADVGSGAGGGDDGGGPLDALSNPVPDAVADTGGSRIKIQYYVGTDGSKVTAGVYDSMLSVGCAYAMAADGSMRCLPTPSAADASLYYADSSCTMPLATVSKGCAAGKYASRRAEASSACAVGVYHLYAVGALFTPGSEIYARPGNACIPLSSSAATANYDLYQVGPEIPPSTFVQATLQTE